MSDKIMDFDQFERVMAALRNTIKAVYEISELSSTAVEMDDSVYVELIRLNNVAVDFLDAYKSKNKEEN